MRKWARIKRCAWQPAVWVIGLCLIGTAPAQAFDWSNLWFSPEQRAAKQLEEQQYDALIENAPDASWRGLGEFRKGEFEAAAKSFGEQREQASNAGHASEAERAMYNQANSHVLQENYQEALNVFDELLESNPLHEDAKHNRDIAQQLLEQQQQQQQQQESGEQGEQGDENQSESGDNQDQQSDGEQSSENQDSEQGESQEQDQQSPDQQADGNAQSDDESDDQNAEEASAAEQEQAAQDAAAEAAMEAERQRAAQADAEPAENAEQSQSSQPATPLTEREQANEQWLRQIPDDPAGLLQRKIQNRHMTDFPEVNNSDQPW